MDNTRIDLAYVFAKFRTFRGMDFYQIHVCNDTQYHAFGHKMSPKSSKQFLSYGELKFGKKIKEKTFKFKFITYLHQRVCIIGLTASRKPVGHDSTQR